LIFGKGDPEAFLAGKGRIRAVVNGAVRFLKGIHIVKGHIDPALRRIGHKDAFFRFHESGHLAPEFNSRVSGPFKPFGLFLSLAF
jgi:hypothetical protein